MHTERIPNARRMYRRNLHRDEKAVSPVVATLLLILIAVAAAAALYLWVTSFQSHTQSTIGSPGTQSTTVIGGSATLYPLDSSAVAWFEQNNSNIQITNNQGGSGAGLVALCYGQVNIATSSEYITQASNIPSSCLNQVVSTRIGTGAVDVLTGSNVGLQAVSMPELDCIYLINGGGTYPGSICTNDATGGLHAPTGLCPTNIPGASGACYVWGDLPANSTYSGGSWLNLCGTPGSSPCLVSGSTTPITVYGRADSSGFMEGFIDQLLGTSCSNNLIVNCFPQTTVLTGETALTAAILANANGLGFVSTGYAASDSISSSQLPAAQSCATFPAAQGCTLQPTPVVASTAHILSGSYQGWRPLFYYTLGPASGTAAAFIQFVEQPYVNAQLCSENNFISYTSGAPNAAGQH